MTLRSELARMLDSHVLAEPVGNSYTVELEPLFLGGGGGGRYRYPRRERHLLL